jgi:hypothetical protein
MHLLMHVVHAWAMQGAVCWGLLDGPRGHGYVRYNVHPELILQLHEHALHLQ